MASLLGRIFDTPNPFGTGPITHLPSRAAMIYQHATTQRDKSIADALSASIAEERDRARSGHDR